MVEVLLFCLLNQMKFRLIDVKMKEMDAFKDDSNIDYKHNQAILNILNQPCSVNITRDNKKHKIIQKSCHKKLNNASRELAVVEKAGYAPWRWVNVESEMENH